MYSLLSDNSRASSALHSLRRVSSLAAGALAVCGALGCSGDDEGGAATIALADSGSISSLVDPSTPLAIPTTVAVRNGVAWVAESQFDQFEAFGGAGMPGGFRIVGLPLAGGQARYIELPDGFYPEGITVSPGGYLFVGSVPTGVIFAVPPNADTAQLFVGDNVLTSSAIGMTVDPTGETLWVCDSDLPGQGTTARVHGIAVADGQVRVTHEIPAQPGAMGAFCNDVLVSPDGALWITESFGGQLLRIPQDQLFTAGVAPVWLQSATLQGNAATPFGVNGLALLGDRLYVAITATGLLYNIDTTLDAPTSEDLRRVVLSDPLAGSTNVALAAPDGMTRISDTELLIVENGLGVEGGRRVVRVSFDLL